MIMATFWCFKFFSQLRKPTATDAASSLVKINAPPKTNYRLSTVRLMGNVARQRLKLLRTLLIGSTVPPFHCTTANVSFDLESLVIYSINRTAARSSPKIWLTFKFCSFHIIEHGGSISWVLLICKCLVQCQGVQIHSIIQIDSVMNYL